MGNVTANGSLNHHWVDITSEKDINESLYSLLDSDSDLTENEEYFSEGTLELGYKNEADRIIKEALKDNPKVTNIKTFRDVANKVVERISGQDYYGECDLSIIALTETKFAVAFSIGGRDDMD